MHPILRGRWANTRVQEPGTRARLARYIRHERRQWRRVFSHKGWDDGMPFVHGKDGYNNLRGEFMAMTDNGKH